MFECMVEPFVTSKAKASRNRVAELSPKHCPFQTLGVAGALIWTKSSVELIWVKSWIPNTRTGRIMGGRLASKVAFILLDSMSWQLTEGGQKRGGGFSGSLNMSKGSLNLTGEWLKSGDTGPDSTWVFLVFSTCLHQGNWHLFGMEL